MGEIVIGGRYAVLPTRAIADTQLSRRDVFVLAVLASVGDGNMAKRRDGWFQISQSVVARLCGSPRPAVNASIRKLVQTRYLEKRQRMNQVGGTDPCEYRIVQDGELDPTFDRWRLLPAQGRLPLDETQQNQGVTSGDTPVTGGDTGVTDGDTPSGLQQNQGVTSGDTPVTGGDTGVTDGDTPSGLQQNQGVSNPDTPPIESIVENLTEDKIRESNRTSNENQFFESSIVEPGEVGSIVNLFLDLRKQFFPGATTGVSSREKLADQVLGFVARGATIGLLDRVLRERLQNHASLGLEAPTGITRFRKDILKAAGNGGLFEPAQRPAAPVAPATKPKGAAAADPVMTAQWSRTREEIAAADATGVARAWLSAATIGLAGDRAVVKLPSVMARDQVKQIEELVSSACRDAFGVAGVDIVHIAGQSRERRTGGA